MGNLDSEKQQNLWRPTAKLSKMESNIFSRTSSDYPQNEEKVGSEVQNLAAWSNIVDIFYLLSLLYISVEAHT